MIVYGRGAEMDNCPRQPGVRAVAVEASWPSPRRACVYERRDGTQFSLSDYTRQLIALGFFGLLGLGGSAALVVMAVRETRTGVAG